MDAEQDIVERLRERAKRHEEQDRPASADLYRDAAAEITLLRVQPSPREGALEKAIAFMPRKPRMER